MKRFPGKSNKHTDPQQDQRLVTGRFSPDSRPVPRTPNLVLDNNNNNNINNNNTHLELEVGINKDGYFINSQTGGPFVTLDNDGVYCVNI